jgi:tRNA(Ile)-lysidine synthase
VGAVRIAVAQNRNDQVETILMRLMRGTGLDGLKGIPVKRAPCIIRPILFAERADIEAHCAKRQLPVCYDHTNDETVYTRNKIRHELIPYIESNFNARIMDGLCRLGRLVRKDLDFIETSLSEALKKEGVSLNAQTPICLKWFGELHEALRPRLLRRIISVTGEGLKDVSSGQIDELLDIVLENKHGKKRMVSGVLFRVEYGFLKYETYTKQAQVSPVDFSLKALHKKEMSMETYSGYTLKHGEVAVDLYKIAGDLSVRRRENGDTFHPLGMKGTKKLKKFFIDLKIPAIERDEIPLLCDEKGIIWVVGHRLSERVKVDEKTCCVGIFKWSDGC